MKLDTSKYYEVMDLRKENKVWMCLLRYDYEEAEVQVPVPEWAKKAALGQGGIELFRQGEEFFYGTLSQPGIVFYLPPPMEPKIVVGKYYAGFRYWSVEGDFSYMLEGREFFGRVKIGVAVEDNKRKNGVSTVKLFNAPEHFDTPSFKNKEEKDFFFEKIEKDWLDEQEKKKKTF